MEASSNQNPDTSLLGREAISMLGKHNMNSMTPEQASEMGKSIVNIFHSALDSGVPVPTIRDGVVDLVRFANDAFRVGNMPELAYATLMGFTGSIMDRLHSTPGVEEA